jgi:hypothetical protein
MPFENAIIISFVEVTYSVWGSFPRNTARSGI